MPGSRHRVGRPGASRAYDASMSESSPTPTVREATLPGIGKKYVMPLRAGGHVAIIVRAGGERQLYHFLDQEDRPCDVVKVDRDEAQQMANLLGGARVAAPDVNDLQLVLGALEIEWIDVHASSTLVDRSLGDSALRSRTGASVVAVLREGEAIPNPDVSLTFRVGDTLLIVGSDEQTTRARALIQGSFDPST